MWKEDFNLEEDFNLDSIFEIEYQIPEIYICKLEKIEKGKYIVKIDGKQVGYIERENRKLKIVINPVNAVDEDLWEIFEKLSLISWAYLYQTERVAKEVIDFLKVFFNEEMEALLREMFLRIENTGISLIEILPVSKIREIVEEFFEIPLLRDLFEEAYGEVVKTAPKWEIDDILVMFLSYTLLDALIF